MDLKAQSLKVGMAGIELRGYYIAPGEKVGGGPRGRYLGNSDLKSTWGT